MAKCIRCQGQGEESYDEDGRMFTDVCYHCGGEGTVDDETDHHDRLMLVANALAYQEESEYRKWCNSDPDGDGYDLGAYENGMMPFDYFRCRVWERAPEIGEKLSAMSREDQEFMIAWNEYDWEVPRSVKAIPSVAPHLPMVEVNVSSSEEEIPF